jgi:hypothetical protein
MSTINAPRKGEIIAGRCVVAWSTTGAGYVAADSTGSRTRWTQELHAAQRFDNKGEIVALLGDRQIEIFGVQAVPCETTMKIAGNPQRIKIERAVTVATTEPKSEPAKPATADKSKAKSTPSAPLLDAAGDKPKGA